MSAYAPEASEFSHALPGNRRVMTGGMHVTPGEPVYVWTLLQGKVVYALGGYVQATETFERY